MTRLRAAGAAWDLPAGLLLGCVVALPRPRKQPRPTRRRNLPTRIVWVAISIPTPRAWSTAKPNRWFFRPTRFAQSVHAKLACVDCHTGIKDLVHDPLPPPDCTHCHEKEAKDYATSIHGVSHLLGASGAANCWDCHGSHGILPVKDPASPVFKMNLPFTCAKCHSNPGLTKEYEINHPEAAAQYMDSIHGQRAAQNGSDCRAVVRRLPRRA